MRTWPQYYRHTGTGVPLREIESTLRRSPANALPGFAAPVRFAPDPRRQAWRTGKVPSESRQAATIVVLYPHETRPSVALIVRASGLARHPGQISHPGGATD